MKNSTMLAVIIISVVIAVMFTIYVTGSGWWLLVLLPIVFSIEYESKDD